jgi:hypothetical protein
MSIADRAAGWTVLETLAAHLEASGIEVDEIGRIAKLGGYQSASKLRGADGVDELVVSDLFKWEISPKFDAGPEWVPVDRGPAVRIVKRNAPVPVSDVWRTAVVWPDTQIGYFRGVDEELVATHDEAAIRVALSVVREVRPTEILRVGDDLDLPDLGKYRTTPAFAFTTQAAIDRATVLGAEQRDAAPNARIVWLAGNHEERLSNYVLDNAKAAYGLRRGRFEDGVPSGWPVLSVPYLCRLDDFEIEYRPGFPAADFELVPSFRIVHGLHVTSNGSTASKYLSRERSSVAYGHVHRREYAARTFKANGVPVEIFAASPGCLARIDGAVPSTKGATDLDGRPVSVVEDWQQGIGLVHYRTDADVAIYENVEIRSDGPVRWARYGGKVFEEREP